MVASVACKSKLLSCIYPIHLTLQNVILWKMNITSLENSDNRKEMIRSILNDSKDVILEDKEMFHRVVGRRTIWLEDIIKIAQVSCMKQPDISVITFVKEVISGNHDMYNTETVECDLRMSESFLEDIVKRYDLKWSNTRYSILYTIMKCIFLILAFILYVKHY